MVEVTAPDGTKSVWAAAVAPSAAVEAVKKMITLQDAGTYITKLPKAEHEAAEW